MLVIADKSANTKQVALLSAIRDFKIGKFVGAIHGKSSSLLKKIAAKAAISESVRSGAFAHDSKEKGSSPAQRGDSSYADWWEAKYWEEIKRKNIKLFGKRSKLAEEKRSQEFWRLLKEGTPQQLADFVKKISRVWYQYTDHVIRDQKRLFYAPKLRPSKLC